MTTVPLYSETRELWALVSTGVPAGQGLRGEWRGRILRDPSGGGFRLRRRAWRRRPAIDEPVEVRRFRLICEAFVDEGRPSPQIRFRTVWVPEAAT